MPLNLFASRLSRGKPLSHHLVKASTKEYFSSTPLQRVSLGELPDALRESAPHVEDIDDNPALRLIEFYESLFMRFRRRQSCVRNEGNDRSEQGACGLESRQIRLDDTLAEAVGLLSAASRVCHRKVPKPCTYILRRARA